MARKSSSVKEDSFREIVSQTLKEQHSAGMMQGAYAMCKVVQDKLEDQSRSVEARLEDALEFCRKMTKVPPKKNLQ